jgi:hypothetical protein
MELLREYWREKGELLREYWRQLGLPECPHCGGSNLSPSRPRLRDRPLAWLSLFPFRCTRCACRFYLRRPGGGDKHRGRG